jgi:hypothetical protein
MAGIPDSPARLSAAMISRAHRPPVAGSRPVPRADALPAGESSAGWRQDLGLFALTWSAGFVFFLTFIA